MQKLLVWMVTLFLVWPFCSYSFSDDVLDQLAEYTDLGSMYATNNLHGSVQGLLIALDNGMIFKFTDDDYLDDDTPEVSVFERDYSIREAKETNPNATSGYADYKLVIDDEVFNVTRIK